MRFSIITVTRNNRAGLRATRQSLMAQDYRDFEWIIIDGASGDGTQEEAAGYGARFYSAPDEGIYDAMNKGLALAAGTYVLFLNAADRLENAAVLGAVAALPLYDFIYGDGREGNLLKRARPARQRLWSPLTYHQAMFYRRETIGALRYDTAYKIAADYKFTLEILARARTILYWPYPVCLYETDGLSQRNARQARFEMARIRREQRLCGPVANLAIVAAQSVAWTIRCRMPRLYGYWRGR